jgi:membrane protease YdiL (CAAX protease family)
MDNRYAAHDAFIRPAFGAPEFWRVIVMIVAFEVVFVLSGDVFAALLPTEGLRQEFYDGVTTFGTLAQFLSFGIALAGFLLLLSLLHGRGIASLIGPYEQARRDLILVTLGVSFWLLVIEILPPWIDPSQVEMPHGFVIWLGLVPVTLAVLLVQVGTEELFFRGYLQQQFAAVSRSPWAWMVVPSVMFGGLHYWNGNGPAEGLVWAVWATALGIACADLTARTGNIGAAVALHLANNAFALLIVHIAGWPTSGVALFLYPYEDPALYSGGLETLAEPWMVFEAIVLGMTTWIMWLAARITLRC